MMRRIEHAIQLIDGRNLAALEQGPSGGQPVIYLHGTPGSFQDHTGFDELYRQMNVRLISVNRPGIGTSTASDNWNALSFADDLLELMKQLDIDKATVIGFSAGGLYACAFAYRYPERVTRLALLSSVAPFDIPLLDKQRTDSAKMLHDTARDNPAALLEQFSAITTPEALFALLESLLAPQDQKIFAQREIASRIIDTYADVLAQGIDKMIKEITLFSSTWGFYARDITVDTLLWHGTADINIPVACSEYLAEQIPNATATYLEEAGHFFSFEQWPELLREIMAD